MSNGGSVSVSVKAKGSGWRSIYSFGIVISYKARSCAYTKDLEEEACHTDSEVPV